MLRLSRVKMALLICLFLVGICLMVGCSSKPPEERKFEGESLKWQVNATIAASEVKVIIKPQPGAPKEEKLKIWLKDDEHQIAGTVNYAATLSEYQFQTKSPFSEAELKDGVIRLIIKDSENLEDVIDLKTERPASQEIKQKAGTEQNKAVDKVKVSPSSLFQGDAKRLEPHLGLISGCVNIQFEGQKKYLNGGYEIWEKGKLKRKWAPASISIDGKFDGEVSFSTQNESTNDQKQLNRTTLVVGGSSCRGMGEFTIPNDSRSPKPLDKPIEISVGEERAVWAYLAHDGNRVAYSSSESIEEAAKKAPWVLVLKVSVTNELPKSN